MPSLQQGKYLRLTANHVIQPDPKDKIFGNRQTKTAARN